jgi:shikimate kinase
MSGTQAESSASTLHWRGRPILLVGHMGSGKSSIGRRLAATLGWPFVDSDAEIEQAAGMSIADIFARFGEPHFRDGERRVIARLLEGGPRVIATGGGAFMDPGTRALALQRATVAWLDPPIDTLVARVGRRNTRPLLVGRDAREVLEDLAAKRNPAYAEAHIRIVCGDGPHEQAVRALRTALEGLGR